MLHQSFSIAHGFRESPEGDLDSGFTNYNSIQLQLYKTLLLAFLRQFKSGIFLDVCGLPWMSVGSQGFLWTLRDVCGCLRTLKDFYGFLCLELLPTLYR